MLRERDRVRIARVCERVLVAAVEPARDPAIVQRLGEQRAIAELVRTRNDRIEQRRGVGVVPRVRVGLRARQRLAQGSDLFRQGARWLGDAIHDRLPTRVRWLESLADLREVRRRRRVGVGEQIDHRDELPATGAQARELTVERTLVRRVARVSPRRGPRCCVRVESWPQTSPRRVDTRHVCSPQRAIDLRRSIGVPHRVEIVGVGTPMLRILATDHGHADECDSDERRWDPCAAKRRTLEPIDQLLRRREPLVRIAREPALQQREHPARDARATVMRPRGTGTTRASARLAIDLNGRSPYEASYSATQNAN